MLVNDNALKPGSIRIGSRRHRCKVILFLQYLVVHKSQLDAFRLLFIKAVNAHGVLYLRPQLVPAIRLRHDRTIQALCDIATIACLRHLEHIVHDLSVLSVNVVVNCLGLG